MRQRWMNYDGVYLAVVPGKQEPTIDVDDVKKHCWTKGYVARTFDTKSSPNSFHGMVIPGLLDFSICNRWIDFCKKHHSLQNCGRGSDINAVAELKLIDCSTDDHCFKIVSGSLTQTYAALSYVWGNHKPVIAWDKGHPNSGANILQAKSLPKVIYDAIIATKKLKLQFLWVDQYCIDQDNEKEKEDLIDKMDVIYAHSEVALVAAAGEGSNHGLPGVTNIHRTVKYQAHACGGVLVAIPGRPSLSIQKSRWVSRGWTYQEAVLARRRLVFTQDQVYFACCSTNCCESIYSPLDFLHRNDKASFRNFVRSGHFTGFNSITGFRAFNSIQCDTQPTFTEYLVHVENFSQRELSHQSDSLNAFRGTIRKYGHMFMGSLCQIWGLGLRSDDKDLGPTTLGLSLTWKNVSTAYS